jgi:hypothetical protein
MSHTTPSVAARLAQGRSITLNGKRLDLAEANPEKTG